MGIVTNAAEPADNWTLNIGDEGLHLILSEQEVQASDIMGDRLTGQSLTLTMLAAGAPVPPQLTAEARAIIIEVQPDSEASMARLAGLRAANPKLMLVSVCSTSTSSSVMRVLSSAFLRP